MTIERKTIQVVVFDGSREHPLLSSWLLGFPHVLRFRDVQPGKRGSIYLQTCRNLAIAWFLREMTLPWLLLLDDDQVPVSETEKLVACEADVASSEYVSQKGEMLHPHSGGLCGGAMKVSRYALEKMGPPWFGVKFSEDGCRAIECECEWFARRALEAGFHPVKAGVCGHIVSYVAMPTDEGGLKILPLAAISEALHCGTAQPHGAPTEDDQSSTQGEQHHKGQALSGGCKGDGTIGRPGQGARQMGQEATPAERPQSTEGEKGNGGKQQAGSHGHDSLT